MKGWLPSRPLPEATSFKWTEEKDVSSPRLWRTVAVLSFPRTVVPAAPPTNPGSLPEAFRPASRIPTKSTTEVLGITVCLEPWHGPDLHLGMLGLHFDPATLRFFVSSERPDAALSTIDQVIEPLLDDLSFQL